jgi:broad specificity phosphatase PhoE
VQDPTWLAWSLTGRWDGIPGCEGDDAFRARVLGAVERIAAVSSGARVAVVAHGGTINAVLAAVLGVERSLWMTVENTSITVLRLSARRGPTVVAVNDCHHLYDPVLGNGA